MLGRLVGPLALLVLLAPFAAGALPPAAVTDPNAEIVSDHTFYHYDTQRVCTSGDPALGIVNTDLTSRLTHASDGGSTTFTLHLDAIPGDAACSALDLVFSAPLEYPGTSPAAWAAFSAVCGATGFVGIYHFSTGSMFQLYLSAPNGECGFAPGFHVGSFSITRPVAGPALACAPAVVPTCAGVYDREPAQRYSECDGQAESTSVIVLFDLVSARRQCQFWNDGEEHVVVSDSFGFVTIDTTEDSCTVNDALLGVVNESCPEEVRSAIFGTDWGHVLP